MNTPPFLPYMFFLLRLFILVKKVYRKGIPTDPFVDIDVISEEIKAQIDEENERYRRAKVFYIKRLIVYSNKI